MKCKGFKWLVLLVASGVCFLASSVRFPKVVLAQNAERADRSEDREGAPRDEREARREAWRNRFGGGEGFRAREFWRGRDRREENRSVEERSNESAPNSAGSSTTTSRAAGSSSGDASPNVKEYARNIVRQHDKDGDNMLRGDELRSLRDRAASADFNSDGVITIDELVIHFTNNTSAAARAGGRIESSSNGGSSGRRERDRERFSRFQRGDRDRNPQDESPRESAPAAAQRVYLGSVQGKRAANSEQERRRTYRFTPPAERLPEGLPSWFQSRDSNGDGQVSMSEYSRQWSRRTVDEFRRYDLNDDGIITPKEAAAK